MKNFKRTLSVILVLALALAFTACGSEKKLNGTVDELKAAVSAVNAEGELVPYDEDRLIDDLGIKSSEYSEGFYLIPINSAGVETIAFFVCADSASADSLKLKLETHVTDVRNKQKDYNADNYQVALDAVVVKEGVYVYLVMSPAKDAIVKAIGDKLK